MSGVTTSYSNRDPDHHGSLPPQTQIIKSWNWGEKKVILFKRENQLHAGFYKGDLFFEVPKLWIEGIPQAVEDAPEKYRCFFDGTCARIAPLDQEEWKLIISPTLKGGMLPKRKKGPNIERQQIPRLNPETLKKTRDGIQKYANTAKGKSIFMLMGPTKAGKSTLTNHLRGKELVKKPDGLGGNVLDVTRGESSPVIGQKNAVSQSKYACTYGIKDHDSLCVTDTGGLFDSDKAQEIPNAICMKLTLQAAKDVKIGLCCNLSAIRDNTGKIFHDSLEILFENFLSSAIAYDSVILIITHAEGATKPAIIELFENNIRDLENEGYYSDLVKILKHLLRKKGDKGEKGDFVIVYDATQESCKSELMKVVHDEEFPAIKDKNIFGNAYSLNAEIEIRNEIKTIAYCGKNLFEEFFQVDQDLSITEKDLASAKEELKKIKDKKSALEKDGKDPALVEKEQAQINQAHQTLITELENSIKTLSSQSILVSSNKGQHENELQELNSKDNDLVPLWEKVKNTPHKHGYNNKKRWFKYDGSTPIEKVVYTPSNMNCWSEIKYTKGKPDFCALFTGTSGKPITTVKVELMQLHKDKREAILKKEELQGKINQCHNSLNSFRDQIQTKQKEIVDLNNKIEQGKKLIEVQDKFKAILEDYDEQIKSKTELIAILETKQKELGDEKKDKKAEITKHFKEDGDFSFLCDYLELSQDALSKEPLVMEFMELKKEYEKK